MTIRMPIVVLLLLKSIDRLLGFTKKNEINSLENLFLFKKIFNFQKRKYTVKIIMCKTKQANKIQPAAVMVMKIDTIDCLFVCV